MEHRPPLRLRFVLETADDQMSIDSVGPSSAQLRELFAIVDATATAVLVAEGEGFIDALDLPAPTRLEAKRRLGRGEPLLSYATELENIGAGSLILDVIIDPERLLEVVSIVLAWAATKGLDRAWESIRPGQGLGPALGSMFDRSRETVEHSVSSSARRTRTIEVNRVVETTNDQGERTVETVAVCIPVARPRDLEQARELLRDLRIID